MLILRTADDVGALMRDRRRALGLSQQGLAERIGSTRRWVIDIERGKPAAEVGMILRALDALGVQLTVTTASDAKPVDGPDIDAVIQRTRRGRR